MDNQQFARLTAAVWADSSIAGKLLEDTSGTLKELGVEAPAEVKASLLFTRPDGMGTFVVPARPDHLPESSTTAHPLQVLEDCCCHVAEEEEEEGR